MKYTKTTNYAIAEVNYHTHDSLTWIDETLDLHTGIVSTKTETNMGFDDQYTRYEKTDSSRTAKPLTVDQQTSIVNTLFPLHNTVKQYPHLKQYRYFGKKHQYLIQGRLASAVKIAGNSDYHGTNCGEHIFVLADLNLIVFAFTAPAYWTCEVKPIVDSGAFWLEFFSTVATIAALNEVVNERPITGDVVQWLRYEGFTDSSGDVTVKGLETYTTIQDNGRFCAVCHSYHYHGGICPVCQQGALDALYTAAANTRDEYRAMLDRGECSREVYASVNQCALWPFTALKD